MHHLAAVIRKYLRVTVLSVRCNLPLPGLYGQVKIVNSAWFAVLLFQMVHIFASETDHFPPIKALFELVTSVTLSIFQQGRGTAGVEMSPLWPVSVHLGKAKGQKQIWKWILVKRSTWTQAAYIYTHHTHTHTHTHVQTALTFPITIIFELLPHCETVLIRLSLGGHQKENSKRLKAVGLSVAFQSLLLLLINASGTTKCFLPALYV